MNTRKYHGLLVAAMTPPVRRMVILSRVDETVVTDAGRSTSRPTSTPARSTRWGISCSGRSAPSRSPLGVPGRRVRRSKRASASCRARTPSASPTRCWRGTEPSSWNSGRCCALRGIHELIVPVERPPPGRGDGPPASTASRRPAGRPKSSSPTTASSPAPPSGTSTPSTAGSRNAGTRAWKTCGRPAWSLRTLSPGQTVHLASARPNRSTCDARRPRTELATRR